MRRVRDLGWRKKLPGSVLFGFGAAALVAFDRTLGSPVAGFIAGFILWYPLNAIWDWGRRRGQ